MHEKFDIRGYRDQCHLSGQEILNTSVTSKPVDHPVTFVCLIKFNVLAIHANR